MFSRITRSVAQVAVKRSVVFRAPVARSFGAHASHDEAPATHGNQTRADGVVIPELVETLEWVLDSPPNVHQFEEPPVVVEIDHLKNMKFTEH